MALADEEGKSPHKPNAAERNLSDIDFNRFLIATFLLCTARCILLQPLFLIATRKQACSISGSKSFARIVRELHAQEGGIFALWQGVVAVVLGMACSETAHNAVYEWSRYQLEFGTEVLGEHNTLGTAGAAAGGAWISDFTSRAIYCPLGVVAMRQMMFRSPSSVGASSEIKLDNANIRHVASRLYQHRGGLRNFYSGFGLIVVVGGVTGSIFFSTYVSVKKLLYGTFTPFLERKEAELAARKLPGVVPSWMVDSKDNILLNSAASITGSCLAGVILNPYYVVLSRRQSGVANSVREAASSVYRLHGLRGFCRGVVTSSALHVFDSLMASTTYEASMHFSQRQKHE